MNVPIEAALLRRFRCTLTRTLGLHLDGHPADGLADLLRRRSESAGVSLKSYLSLLERGDSDGELALLAAELTVPESYFFRHKAQFQALADEVLPDLLRNGHRRLRILSAG